MNLRWVKKNRYVLMTSIHDLPVLDTNINGTIDEVGVIFS